MKWLNLFLSISTIYSDEPEDELRRASEKALNCAGVTYENKSYQFIYILQTFDIRISFLLQSNSMINDV